MISESCLGAAYGGGVHGAAGVGSGQRFGRSPGRAYSGLFARGAYLSSHFLGGVSGVLFLELPQQAALMG